MGEFTTKQYAQSVVEVTQETFKGGVQFFRAAGQLTVLGAIEATDAVGDWLDRRWAKMMDLGDEDGNAE